MGGEPRKLGDVLPPLAVDDSAHMRTVDAKPNRHVLLGISGSAEPPDFPNVRFGELGRRRVFPANTSRNDVADAMCGVFLGRHPLEVENRIIAPVGVLVVGDLARQRLSQECRQHEPVYAEGDRTFAVPCEIDAKITLGHSGAEFLASKSHGLPAAVDGSIYGANLTKVGNLVKALITNNRPPLFGNFSGRICVSHSLPSMGALVRAVVGVLAPGGSFVSGATLSRVSA